MTSASQEFAKLKRLLDERLNSTKTVEQCLAVAETFIEATGRDNPRLVAKMALHLVTKDAEYELDRLAQSKATKRGMKKARDDGVQIGRPEVPRPDGEKVRSLRRLGFTWPFIAARLKCTLWAARRAEEMK